MIKYELFQASILTFRKVEEGLLCLELNKRLIILIPTFSLVYGKQIGIFIGIINMGKWKPYKIVFGGGVDHPIPQGFY